MARESFEDFLSFMREKPRTWGWDALVAYDRETTNDLLMQEYIDRFDNGTFFETLTFAVPLTQGWQVSEGQRLDKPRLKFEAADLSNSSADLSMRIVGGRQFHVGLDLNRGYRFNSIKLADALNGPVLHVRLELGKTPGHVERLIGLRASVIIDLSNPSWEFYLTFSDYPEENHLGGARYKEIFANWPDEKKALTLCELSIVLVDLVQPESFLIRTHAEPNATDGEGAVLLFVTMKGSENGSLPAADKDFHYLLPEAPNAEMPYSTNVVFSHNFFLPRMVEQWFFDLQFENVGKPYEFEVLGGSDGGFIQGVRVTHGALQVPRFETDPETEPYLRFGDFPLAFADDYGVGQGAFTVTPHQSEDGWFTITWTGGYSTSLVAKANRNSREYASGVDYWWSLSVDFAIEIDGDKRAYLKVERWDMQGGLEFGSYWSGWAAVDPDVYKIMSEANTLAPRLIEQRMQRAFETFSMATRFMNLLLLHGFIFKGGANTIQPDKGYNPGDFVLPGYLAPSQTTLKLNATEVTIGAGSFYQFTAEPSSGVTWAVSNLPDEEGDCGSIDANGKYTPMVASTIPHAQKVVIVTATSGEHISRALVTVIKRSIALDPVIMTAQQLATKDNVYKVSGASLQGSNLQWRMSEGAIGSIQTDPNPLPDVQDGRLYVVPKKSSAATMAFDERYGKLMPVASEQWQARRAAGCKFSAADLSDLMAVEQIIVEGENDSQTIDVLLPLQNETHWFQYQPMADGSVQLELWTDTMDGALRIEPEAADWFLVKGNGTLDLGLYTPAADGSDSYAVVVAFEPGNPRGYWWTYAILPMPYLDVAHIIENGESS
ncbi:hypothetical protein [Pseudomonas putida]|uniref:hypothetical protein n=1 Tax=Pseudomonas putida TaxID=303 RepID=UPI001F521740|nr:hypothetical protein [Pseudomonas putida]MCI0910840.1 hypothetical protein [Pseudomonas putida]